MQKELYLAGGCFWGVEGLLGALDGVLSTQVGYANGGTASPTYQDVCTGTTGHTETVRVVYDPERISLPMLLHWFFRAIDPFAVNRQGPDRGTQYRSGIYYTDPGDEAVIRAAADALQQAGGRPVATEILPLSCFYPAEANHQQYLKKNPGGYCHIPQALLQEARRRTPPVPNAYRRPPEDALRSRLSPLAYAVTRQGATEPPFSHPEWNRFEPGIYVDAATGEPLFTSKDKFFSACGWPSFSRPIVPDVVLEREDTSHGMHRTEVRSRGGDSHLGHVFPDGDPAEGGLRYCINGAALRFIPQARMEEEGYGAYLIFVE